jgi:hypothetical protein
MGFAAWLQVHDDNQFLSEWLAFHSHTLPLRRLIVFNDPRSTISPEPILDRWSGAMEIPVSSESQVYPLGVSREGEEEWPQKDSQKQRPVNPSSS